MARGLKRASVLGVKKEVTEGLPVIPASSSDYVVLQPDFEPASEFEQLINDELRNSIGPSKPSLGVETASFSLSHYLKGSGTEGVGPEIEDMLESLLGSKSVNSTERSTTTGSTVSQINLSAGGSDFAKGKAVLIKGSTRYIRPVHSVSSNNLTLGFDLPSGAAPGSGVAVGKCVNWSPASSGHPTLTFSLYKGNGHSIEMLSGMRAVSMSAALEAGQNINASFEFQGKNKYFNPIEITSSTNTLDFSDGSTRSCTVEAKWYKSPAELASALQTAMNSVGSSDTFTVIWNSKGVNKGKFTISTNGATLSLLFATGANTSQTIATKLNFTVADESGNTSYNSDSEASWAAPHTPVYDSTDPNVAIANELFIGDSDDNVNFCASSVELNVQNSVENDLCITAENGVDAVSILSRTESISITGYLEKHDVDLFDRFINNTDTRFMLNFGVKVAGQWQAGKCYCIYVPQASIQNLQTTDLNEQTAISFDVIPFVAADGSGEFFINQL